LLADPRDQDLRSLFGARGALESAEFLRWPCLLVLDGEGTAPRGQLTVRTSSAEAASALASSLEPRLLALPTASGAARVVRPGWKVTSTAAGELFFGCEEADFVVALGEPRASEFQPAARDLEPALEPRVTFTLDAVRLAALDWPFALGFGAERAQRLAPMEDWPARLEFGCEGGRSRWVWRKDAGAGEAKALPDAALALVPSSALQAFVQHGDPAALLDVEALPSSVPALGRLVEAHRELLSALVASMGTIFGNYSIEAPWNESGLATVAFAEVVDAARFERALVELLERLAARPSSPTERYELRSVTLAGVEARVVTLGSLPRPLELALALHGDHLFLAETPQTLERALESARSGASLLDRPEFAGARHAGLHSLAFTDVARLAQHVEPALVRLLLGLFVRGADEPTPEPTEWLEETFAGARPWIEQVTLEHGQLVARGTGDASLLALLGSQWVQGSVFAGALLQILVTPAPTAMGEVERAEADLRALKSAVDSYAIENYGRYPDSLLALVTPDAQGFTFLRGTEVPRDPWGHEYGYEWDGSHPDGPRVFSLGADGTPGGTGLNRDLDSRTLPQPTAK